MRAYEILSTALDTTTLPYQNMTTKREFKTLGSPNDKFVLLKQTNIERASVDQQKNLHSPAVGSTPNSPQQNANGDGLIVNQMLARGRSTGRRPQGGAKSRKRRSGMAALPPQLECSPKYTATYRFALPVSTTPYITSRTLVACVGCLGTSTTTGGSIASSARILNIKVWPAAGTTVDLVWLADSGHAPDESKDKSLPSGVTVSGLVSVAPPKGSLAGFWWDGQFTDTPLMQFLAGAGSGISVVDVQIQFTLANQLSNQNFSFAAVVLGEMFYPPLDGASTHHMVAIGRNSAF